MFTEPRKERLTQSTRHSEDDEDALIVDRLSMSFQASSGDRDEQARSSEWLRAAAT